MEIELGFCIVCNKRLVPIGRSRKGGKATHGDWSTRKTHKKCYFTRLALSMWTALEEEQAKQIICIEKSVKKKKVKPIEQLASKLYTQSSTEVDFLDDIV
jgi:hypothetical protein